MEKLELERATKMLALFAYFGYGTYYGILKLCIDLSPSSYCKVTEKRKCVLFIFASWVPNTGSRIC